MMNLDFVGLFILIVGFVVGLGAVTVIDLHGFLARKSAYFTLATIRAHRVTKPLIWLGMFLAIVGGVIFYRDTELNNILIFHLISAPLMILNGVFLSFKVSPYLLRKESEGKDTEILSKEWQNKITLSFIVSFALWWGNLAGVVYQIVFPT